MRGALSLPLISTSVSVPHWFTFSTQNGEAYPALSMSTRRAPSNSKYSSIQRRLLREGTLFEDKDFPPTDRTLFTRSRPSVHLEWKRPKVRAYDHVTRSRDKVSHDSLLVYSNTFVEQSFISSPSHALARSRPLFPKRTANLVSTHLVFTHFLNRRKIWSGAVRVLEGRQGEGWERGEDPNRSQGKLLPSSACFFSCWMPLREFATWPLHVRAHWAASSRSMARRIPILWLTH